MTKESDHFEQFYRFYVFRIQNYVRISVNTARDNIRLCDELVNFPCLSQTIGIGSKYNTNLEGLGNHLVFSSFPVFSDSTKPLPLGLFKLTMPEVLGIRIRMLLGPLDLDPDPSMINQN